MIFFNSGRFLFKEYVIFLYYLGYWIRNTIYIRKQILPLQEMITIYKNVRFTY